MIKYQSVTKQDKKTGRYYQVGIALRESGRFEVYSDFLLVNEYMSPSLDCIDIETDFNQFYLKFIKNSHEISPKTDFDDLEIEVRRFQHIWRNQISFSTSKIKKNPFKAWTNALDKRIAPYFKIYSDIVNLAGYIIVAHRNLISVFSLAQG